MTNETKTAGAGDGCEASEYSALLPCPFCGSRNVEHDYQCGTHLVTCKSCESYGPLVRDGDREDAIEKWNDRPKSERYVKKAQSHCVMNSPHCGCQIGERCGCLPG